MTNDIKKNILDMWTALEVLSPQAFLRPEELALGDKKQALQISEEALPWEPRYQSTIDNHTPYFQVVLGTINLPHAMAALHKVYADSNPERRPVRGHAIIATLTLDQTGRLIDEDPICISSFAWALPMALKGKLAKLGDWTTVEAALKAKIYAALDKNQDQDETPPTEPHQLYITHQDIQNTYTVLLESLHLSPDMTQAPYFTVKSLQYVRPPLPNGKAFQPDPPEPLLLNSFYMDDLQLAKELITDEKLPQLAETYLSQPPIKQRCLLSNPAALVNSLAPTYIPSGAWPHPGGHTLNLLQQAAVNMALDLKDNPGLLSVNGPPGTGKTTLLRDIIAAIITERARVMCDFDSPADAFIETSFEKTVTGTSYSPFKLDQRLKGFEILVTSSNNKAVENITAELPARTAIDTFSTASYFKSFADTALEKDTWGLMAIPLGNRNNRYQFRRNFWMDKKTGFRNYLYTVRGFRKKGADVTDHFPDESYPIGKKNAQAKWDKARQDFLKSLDQVDEALQELQTLCELVNQDPVKHAKQIEPLLKKYSGQQITLDYLKNSQEKIHLATPWIDKSLARKRMCVFEHAMAVHKAFIDAAPEAILNNLGILFSDFGSSSLGSEVADKLIPDLWSTLFLLIPVISTTFASLSRMFPRIDSPCIGWLLIDEAGQSLPQATVGALMRSHRAIIVGDPLQIEPVMPLPDTLTSAICKRFNVSDQQYAPPFASAQSLADRISPIGSTLGESKRKVGLPLLVHRRCSSPMFDISNRVAYGNLMVQAKTPSASRLKSIIGESRWIHVESGWDEKWAPLEGEVVLKILYHLRQNHCVPDLYVVTPFAIVQNKIRERLHTSGILNGWVENPRRWLYDHVGTVHTVQGREAEAIVFVLGAQDPEQSRARLWAGKNPNLVNVAVTRAKEALYVVGNRHLWKECGYFKELHDVMR